jgi:hypothetical protein
VISSPPSGSTFPAGTTTVTSIATDASGNQATCQFTVTVNCPPVITFEGGKSFLEFTGVEPVRKQKNAGPDCHCESGFTITNLGNSELVLALDSILRTGKEVARGIIVNSDDSKFFSVRLVNPDQSETLLKAGAGIIVPPGQKQNFNVVFTPIIPASVGRTIDLSASAVLPDLLTSKIVFTGSGINPVIVNIVARSDSRVRIINAANPRSKANRIVLTRTGRELTVTTGVFDASLDVTHASYEFFDSHGALIGQAIDIDLAETIKNSGIVRGQSFQLAQRFAGSSIAQAVSVRVTVFDPETSVTGVANP